MRALSFGLGASPYQEIGAPVAAGSIARVIAAFVTNGTTTPQSLTAPAAGVYRLVLVGPGASGAARQTGSGSASGGGTGGVVVSKPFAMAAGQAQSVTLGVRGTAVLAQAGQAFAGISGSSSTTATLPDGTALSAGPGQGGAHSPGAAVGGAGGTATGGEFNYPGGAGGSTTVNSASGGPREVIQIGGVAVTSPYGSNGRALSGGYAGGGGNTPTGNGLIPPAVGSDGSVGNSNTVDQAQRDIGTAGRGGGGAVGLDSGQQSISGVGGFGAAYLILEIPAA